MALGLATVQFGIFCLIEWYEVQRHLLTIDYSIFGQAAYRISQGAIDPTTTTEGFPFWADHFAWLMWPIGWFIGLTHLPVSFVLLIIFQALPLALVVPILVLWIRHRAESLGGQEWAFGAPLALVVVAVVWVGNIWVYRALSFDFHFQVLQVPVLLALVYFVDRRSRVGTLLMVLLLLGTGDIGGLIVIGVGVIAALLQRRWLLGCGLVLLGAIWIVVLGAFHASRSTNLGSLYGYLDPHQRSVSISRVLIGAVENPMAAIAAIEHSWLGLWSYIGSTGILGLFSVAGLAMVVAVFLPVMLAQNSIFASSGLFQTLPVLVALSFSLLFPWSRLPRRAWLRGGVAAVVVAQVVLWTAIFLPRVALSITSSMPAATARQLSSIAAELSPHDEVVASNGVVGYFSLRRYVYSTAIGSAPLHGRPVDLIVVPWAGTEYSVRNALEEVQAFSKLPGAVVRYRNGVYFGRFVPRPSLRRLDLLPQGSGVQLTALALRSPYEAQRFISTGSSAYLQSTLQGGYLIAGLTRHLVADQLENLTLDLSVAAGSMSVQVWNQGSGQLLVQRTLGPTNGFQRETLSFVTPAHASAHASDGVGIFRALFIAPPKGAVYEVRVWTRSNSIVRVRSVTWTSLSRVTRR